jgi:hypothetical protein
MECIAITKEEDMARLQSMAFLLLSKLYINDPEVVKASLEWAQKSCDAGLILSTENQSVQFHLEKGQVQEANQIALNVENKKTEVEHARHFALKSSLHQIIHVYYTSLNLNMILPHIQWTGSETAGKSK